ncbi:MAG TPA: PEP-CTERM sorting domain-containing protein [Fimbriimonadaceae bacterium]|nr:PEP-CTERM sorting domain-containing protein [Fimbriimonadaceae bacterium]
MTNLANVGYKANFFNDSATVIRGWDEVQNVALSQTIEVDINAMGVYQNPFTSANAEISRGTMVSSHTLYFDPNQSRRGVATFTFDAAIIGIITSEGNAASNDRFMKSDFLIPGAVPAANLATTHYNARGIEFGPEVITWSTPNVLTVDLSASSPGDQIRVITQAVPEPGTIAALGLGALVLVRRKRQLV